MPWINSLFEWMKGLVLRLEPWDAVGFVGHFVFFLRFVVQWIASEKKKRSVVPISFWYLSLSGSAIVLVYAIHVGRLVFILAYSLNMAIYLRNLYFVYRRRRRRGLAWTGRPQPPSDGE